MLCISTHGNSVFRTEELEGIYRVFNDETHKATKTIVLQFKSGEKWTLYCKTLKETNELFDSITDSMKRDYDNLIK